MPVSFSIFLRIFRRLVENLSLLPFGQAPGDGGNPLNYMARSSDYSWVRRRYEGVAGHLEYSSSGKSSSTTGPFHESLVQGFEVGGQGSS